ncbi:unnamed protein product [Mytilus coruscus]|uniref:Uncharacterized protein n=1 Tax=Mytilus coruscus TaxID=42192 RepID=A0A6J7ZXW1_MYTCO|nr:unnamed protein product [Mytilus coruscus]
MIATNIPLFQAINQLPIISNPIRLDEGDGIEDTLRRNNAKYHQNYRLLFDNTKLDRTRKRSAISRISLDDRQSKARRTSIECRASFLCDKKNPTAELRQAMTMQLDKKLNGCARNRNDGKLLTVLSGDVAAQELNTEKEQQLTGIEVSAQLGDAAVSKYMEEGLVCPTVIRKRLFTTAAMENIDHNPTATTATASFHGTSISLFHKVKRVPELPDSFTNIQHAFSTKKNPTPSKANLPLDLNTNECKIDLTVEHEWLEKVSIIEASDEYDNITWSAQHASKKRGPVFDANMGNPFMEETDELFTLDTKSVAHPSAAQMVASHFNNGKTRFIEFMKGLDTEEYSIYQPIKKKKTEFFRQNPELKAGISRKTT